MTVQPQIYVACLSAYNNGHLHGAWIDVNDELETNIQAMLKNSPEPDAEEWAIHDHQGIGRCDEWEDLDTLKAKAAFIKEHGDIGLAVLENLYDNLEDAEQCMENYEGTYKSESEFAHHIFDECFAHEIPKNLQFYFDLELFERDLFISDYNSIEVAGECHIFRQF